MLEALPFMNRPNEDWDLLAQVDALALRLSKAGMDADARRLLHLMHGVSWSISSELFTELETALRSMLTARSFELPADSRAEVIEIVRLLQER